MDDWLVLTAEVGWSLDRWGVAVDEATTYEGAVLAPRWAALFYDLWAEANESLTLAPGFLAFVAWAGRSLDVRRAFLAVAQLGSRRTALDYARWLGGEAPRARKE